MADKLVTIMTFGDYIQAEMARQLLCDNGIESVVAGENAANVYSLPAMGSPELQVFERDAEKARQILESQGKQEA